VKRPIAGFSLIEMMLVVLIFTFLFVAIMALLTTSDRSWREGQRQFTEQQEARRAMGGMGRLLRQSNPDWVISGTHYPVTITLNNRIDFYQPVFDAGGDIAALKKITFKLNPADASQLLKKEGTANEAVIANNVQSVNFGGGCSGCSAFNCPTVASDCPMVLLNIQTKNGEGFSLDSGIQLRNTSIALGAAVVVEEPGQGEF
jgi:type II secretory pathway pseudopilin PulG